MSDVPENATPIMSVEDALKTVEQVLAGATIQLGQAGQISNAWNIVTTAARAPITEEKASG